MAPSALSGGRRARSVERVVGREREKKVLAGDGRRPPRRRRRRRRRRSRGTAVIMLFPRFTGGGGASVSLADCRSAATPPPPGHARRSGRHTIGRHRRTWCRHLWSSRSSPTRTAVVSARHLPPKSQTTSYPMHNRRPGGDDRPSSRRVELRIIDRWRGVYVRRARVKISSF